MRRAQRRDMVFVEEEGKNEGASMGAFGSTGSCSTGGSSETVRAARARGAYRAGVRRMRSWATGHAAMGQVVALVPPRQQKESLSAVGGRLSVTRGLSKRPKRRQRDDLQF